MTQYESRYLLDPRFFPICRCSGDPLLSTQNNLKVFCLKQGMAVWDADHSSFLFPKTNKMGPHLLGDCRHRWSQRFPRAEIQGSFQSTRSLSQCSQLPRALSHLNPQFPHVYLQLQLAGLPQNQRRETFLSTQIP